MITHRFKIAGLYPGVDAEKVAVELEAIGEEITPKQIVDKARDPGTELHKCFTWDDQEAAEKWRLQEARQIVCHLVTEDDDRPEMPPVRCIVQAQGNTYKQMKHVIRNEDEYAALLKRAYADLEAFYTKYKTLSELETVFEAIAEVLIA